MSDWTRATRVPLAGLDAPIEHERPTDAVLSWHDWRNRVNQLCFSSLKEKVSCFHAANIRLPITRSTVFVEGRHQSSNRSAGPSGSALRAAARSLRLRRPLAGSPHESPILRFGCELTLTLTNNVRSSACVGCRLGDSWLDRCPPRSHLAIFAPRSTPPTLKALRSVLPRRVSADTRCGAPHEIEP